jgi:hypothetical protein
MRSFYKVERRLVALLERSYSEFTGGCAKLPSSPDAMGAESQSAEFSAQELFGQIYQDEFFILCFRIEVGHRGKYSTSSSRLGTFRRAHGYT